MKKKVQDEYCVASYLTNSDKDKGKVEVRWVMILQCKREGKGYDETLWKEEKKREERNLKAGEVSGEKKAEKRRKGGK